MSESLIHYATAAGRLVACLEEIDLLLAERRFHDALNQRPILQRLALQLLDANPTPPRGDTDRDAIGEAYAAVEQVLDLVEAALAAGAGITLERIGRLAQQRQRCAS
jgi:hypothetical protein